MAESTESGWNGIAINNSQIADRQLIELNDDDKRCKNSLRVGARLTRLSACIQSWMFKSVSMDGGVELDIIS